MRLATTAGSRGKRESTRTSHADCATVRAGWRRRRRSALTPPRGRGRARSAAETGRSAYLSGQTPVLPLRELDAWPRARRSCTRRCWSAGPASTAATAGPPAGPLRTRTPPTPRSVRRRLVSRRTRSAPSGEPGAGALRAWRSFRLPAHQDTSATLAGAYPFLAEGGLGGEGVFVGQDLYSGGSFVYDPWVLYQHGVITAPNVVLAGIVGAGKSALAKSLYTRSIAFGRRVYVPGDPKGEHTPVAQAVGGQAIVLGHGLPNRLNPLDGGRRPSGVSDVQWAAMVAARRRDLIGALSETVLGRPLSPVEHTAVDIALNAAVVSSETPILPMVVDRILNPDTGSNDPRLAEDGRLVGHALRRLVAGDLAGIFDGPSTVAFDPDLPMVSLDLSRVAENNALVSVLMTCASAWMESALLDPHGGHRWVIYDEAWQL